MDDLDISAEMDGIRDILETAALLESVRASVREVAGKRMSVVGNVDGCDAVVRCGDDCAGVARRLRRMVTGADVAEIGGGMVGVRRMRR